MIKAKDTCKFWFSFVGSLISGLSVRKWLLWCIPCWHKVSFMPRCHGDWSLTNAGIDQDEENTMFCPTSHISLNLILKSSRTRHPAQSFFHSRGSNFHWRLHLPLGGLARRVSDRSMRALQPKSAPRCCWGRKEEGDASPSDCPPQKGWETWAQISLHFQGNREKGKSRSSATAISQCNQPTHPVRQGQTLRHVEMGTHLPAQGGHRTHCQALQVLEGQRGRMTGPGVLKKKIIEISHSFS